MYDTLGKIACTPELCVVMVRMDMTPMVMRAAVAAESIQKLTQDRMTTSTLGRNMCTRKYPTCRFNMNVAMMQAN